MSIVIEDGTGLANATAYVAQATVSAYFAAQGNGAWDSAPSKQGGNATGPERDAAILQAAAYLESNYRGRWKGYRVHQAQALAWPRVMMAPFTYNGQYVSSYRSMSFITDEDGFPILSNQIPTAVKDANCELALIALSGADLFAEPGPAIRMRKAGDTTEVYASAYVERAAGLARVNQMLESLLVSIPGSSFGNVAIVRG